MERFFRWFFDYATRNDFWYRVVLTFLVIGLACFEGLKASKKVFCQICSLVKSALMMLGCAFLLLFYIMSLIYTNQFMGEDDKCSLDSLDQDLRAQNSGQWVGKC